jgi:hypothetical protein
MIMQTPKRSGSQIGALESHVYRRSADAAARVLGVLMLLTTGKLRLEDEAGSPQAADLEIAATRLGAAVGACLADPAARLSAAELERLALLGRTIDNVFAASGFGTTDHVLAALGASDSAALVALRESDPAAFAKACLLVSIDSRLPLDPEALLAASPELALLAYLNQLSAKPITTAAGYARRERLLGLAPQLKPARLPHTIDHLVLLSSGWMLCSYAERRDKHRIKPVLNQVLRAWLKETGMGGASLPAERKLVERPTMLVAAEIMHSNHVQYRYFGQYLRQLRKRFRLVLLTEEGQADANVRPLFDAVHIYQRKGGIDNLRAAAELVKRIAPDLIFWPSVGMRHWGPPLANLRLAPIQFTGLGHSASTFCDTIDYYLTEEGYVGDPALFSERLVLLPDRSLVFERSPYYQPVAPAIREEARPLRVALPSNLLKLNPAFIAVLRRIRDAARRPLSFRVFPNVTGIQLVATRRVLARELPGATVHGMLAYNRYLAELSACDLNLSPFPFGGLHSVVDSLRQGLPVVAMEGLEPHARTDAMLLRRLGMPAELIARDVDGYVAAALRVIDDDALRVRLSRQAVALDIDRVLYGDASTPLRSEVGDAVWWMYRNHEAIQASAARVFRAADRTASSVAA